MGRPKDSSLSYFPMDTDVFQDIRIRKLIKYQKGRAFTVYALLLCFIYKSGYYMLWDEELPFIISEQTGFEEGYIREVINCCLSLGLLSKEMYREHGVLTSEGIQRRYKLIAKQTRRKGEIREYSLVSSEETGVNAEETGVNAEETPKNAEDGTQIKRKRNNKENSVTPNVVTEQKKGGLSFEGDPLADVISEWLAYKRERREAYKSDKSVSVFRKHLYECSRGDPATARAIIEHSIANNWAGIFPLSNNRPNTNSNGNDNTPRQPRAGESYAERAGRLYAGLEQPLAEKYGLDPDG